MASAEAVVALPQGSAFEALDGAAVRWAVLRDDPFAADAADIDLLVHPADAKGIEASLAPLGFGRLSAWRQGDHRFYLAYDERRDAWAKLDVVTRFAYRSGHELPDSVTEAVLARRTHGVGAWRLAPDDEFWALLLHCLLDRGAVADRHAERLWQLAANRPAGPLREAIHSPQVADLVLQRCADRDVSGLLALRAPLAARLPRPPLAVRAMRGARTMASPLFKAVRGRGITVAVLGPDGAGKSTLVASLARGLPMPVRTQYLGLYGSGRRPARLGRVPGVTLIGQLASSWRAYAAAGYHRRRGRVVLFDRYAYDALLPSTRGAGGTKRAVRRAIIGRLAPHPDLVLVLDAPAAKIHDRKAELGIEELERRRDGYRLLAAGLDSTTTTALIDAAADASTVRRHATWLVWRELRRRRGYNRQPQADDERVTDGDR